MEIVSGVYRVIINEKSYIGSSVNVYRRFEQHKRTLSLGIHDNKKLQSAYNKYKTVDFELLEKLYDADAETLADREAYYIKKYNAEYNICKPAVNKNSKPIYQFDLKGNLINKYANVQVASLANGISVSNIGHAAQENEKETRTAGGYFWRYKNTIEFDKDKRLHCVFVYDLEGNYITGFDSLKECVNTLFSGIKDDHNSRINRVARGLACSYRGLRFSYDKVQKLDNKKLLSVEKCFPVVQIAPDKITKIAVFETAALACKKLNIKSTSEITFACSAGKRCRGYYWTRLGTKWSELLEHPEGTETETKLETVSGIV